MRLMKACVDDRHTLIHHEETIPRLCSVSSESVLMAWSFGCYVAGGLELGCHFDFRVLWVLSFEFFIYII